MITDNKSRGGTTHDNRPGDDISPDKKIPCEIYSRVVGYYRPISQWNAGKRAEFFQRLPYVVKYPVDTSHAGNDVPETVLT
jgi:hypothetical protein